MYRILDEGRKKMDQGFDFYAPQTFTSPDGRKILFDVDVKNGRGRREAVW